MRGHSPKIIHNRLVKTFKAAQIDGAEDEAIKISFPSGATRDFTG